MSNDQEIAPVGTPEEGKAEAPETPVTETPVEETATPTEPATEALETPTEPAAEAPVTETAVTEDVPQVTEPVTEREVVAPPDLSELPEDIADDFEKAIEATVLKFKEGDIVEGSIVSIDAEGAMVDVGYKSEGLIPGRELSIRNNVDPKDVVSVGEHVEAVVLDMEDDEGRMILSKKRAMYERAWGRIQKIADEDGTVEGTVRTHHDVLVAKGGKVEGDIHAGEAVIGGEVHGSIFAETRVEVQQGAVVVGDIATKKLVVQEGGDVNGQIRTFVPRYTKRV